MSLATQRQQNGTLGTPYLVSVSANATPSVSSLNVLIIGGTSRMAVSLFNNGSETLYIGDSLCTAGTNGTGFPVPAGTGFTDSLTSSPIYGNVVTGPVKVSVLAVYL